MSRLPPLNALKAFEAAAKNLSFTRGAEDLSVSQSAVSHQVKILETHLGRPLFERLPSGLVLTEAGAALYETVHQAFEMITKTVEETTPPAGNDIITVMMRPFLSFNWLSPRLSIFYERHPDSKVRLQHTNDTIDPQSHEFDIAIVLGDGNWPGMHAEHLMQCELTPICSPRYWRGEGRPRHLSDLGTNTLLHKKSFGNWPRWLSLAGDSSPGGRRHMFIDDTNVRIQAAIKGQGGALSNPKLLSAEIGKGNLVAPFDIMLTDFAYYIVAPKKSGTIGKVKVFKD